MVLAINSQITCAVRQYGDDISFIYSMQHRTLVQSLLVQSLELVRYLFCYTCLYATPLYSTFQPDLPRSSYLFCRTIWFATVWVIWKEKNYYIFQNTASTFIALLEKIKLNSFFWIKFKQTSFCYSYTEWWKHPLLFMDVQINFFFLSVFVDIVSLAALRLCIYFSGGSPFARLVQDESPWLIHISF